MNKIKYRVIALLLCFIIVLSSLSGTPVDAAMIAYAEAGNETTNTTNITNASETSETTETSETIAADTEEADTAASAETGAGIENVLDSDNTNKIEIEKSEATEEEVPKALTLTQTVEEYEIVLTADSGVLPSDAVLVASLIKSSAVTEKIETAIEEEMEDGKKIAQTIAFDITIYDKDGNEIQPDTDKGKVTVTFKNVETNLSNTSEAEVFHVQDDYSGADVVSTEIIGDEIAFQAEHFSLYVIVLEDNEHDYEIVTDVSYKVSEMLEKLWIDYTAVTGAVSSDTGVLNVIGSGNDTCIQGVGDEGGSATLTVTYEGTNGTVTKEIQVTISVSNTSGNCGDSLTWAITKVDDTNYTLTIEGSGAMNNYIDSSGAPWALYQSVITALVLDENMTSIGQEAFSACRNLTGNLTIPNSVTSIGQYAFGGCNNLTGNLTIPNGVTSIGFYAFSGCNGLNGVLTIPESVKSIADGAFDGCSGLTGTLPDLTNMESVGNNAFYNCAKLTGSITFPKSMIAIPERMLGDCSGLTGTLTIPDGVTSIDRFAFKGCSGLDKAVIPDSVTSIATEAFTGWKTGSIIYNLSSVSMATNIYSGATLGDVYTVTTHTEGVTAAAKVPGDGETTFSVADPVKDNYSFLGWYTDAAYTTKWDSTKAVTGNMDLYARLDKIIASGNCGAQGDGSNLTYMVTTTDDTNYTLTISGSGAMADYVESTTLMPWYSYKQQLTSLVLEEGMTTIGVGAFWELGKVSGTLTIPDSVTSIGESAFMYCGALTGDLVIPDHVTSIGVCAFAECKNFTGSLTIPDSVTSIGRNAFALCSGLTGNLTIPDNVTSIGESTFEDCSGLTGNLTIPNSVTSIGDSAFKGCIGFTKVIIPGSTTSIDNKAFYIQNSTTKIYNLSNVTLTQGNHYYSADNLGDVYTVITHVDGTVTSSKKVLGDGTTTVSIADPVKAGHMFTGWYTDSSFTTDKLWNGNNQTVSENLNLYTKLQKVLTVSDISGINNTDAFTYNGSNQIPVTLTLSGNNLSGEGAPVSETATAMATVSSSDAGTYTGYTLTNIALTNGNSSNYTLTGVTEGSITIASEDSDGFGITISKKALTVTAADVSLSLGDAMPELTDSSLTFVGFLDEENKTALNGIPTFTFSQNHTNSGVSDGMVTPGGYTAKNYAITYQPGKLMVNAKTFSSTPYTVSGSNNGETGDALWYTGDITLKPESAVCGTFKYISISTDGGASYSNWDTQAVLPSMDGETPLDTDKGSVKVRFSTAVDGVVGTDRAVVILNDEFTYQRDTTAPAGTITLEEKSFHSFLNTISFGLFFNNDITVSIEEESNPVDLSGTTMYLYKDTTTSTKAKTYEDLNALEDSTNVTTGWKQTDSFSVTAEDQFAVYGKIVDGAGHVTYINTDGIILDKTAPVMTDLSIQADTLMDVTAEAALTAGEAGIYYYAVQKSSEVAPATGEEIAQTTATVRGNGVAEKDVKVELLLPGLSANTAYTIYATVKDAAGNYADIKQVNFTTKKTIPVVDTTPSITGTYGQTVSSMMLTDGTAQVGETTIQGSWALAESYTDVPSVGTKAVYDVAFTPEDSDTYETITVAVNPTITARSLIATGVTVSVTGTYTYTGNGIIPDMSIIDSEATIAIADYELSYKGNTNPGDNTASVTVTGKGNYQGTVTKTFSIAKANTAITIAAGSESYTKIFGDPAFSLTGIAKTGDGTLSYISSDTSVATVSAEGMITIKKAGSTEITVSLPATDNCNGAANKTITVTVEKAPALTIGDITKSYVYSAGGNNQSIDLSATLPKDRGVTTYQMEIVTDNALILSAVPAVTVEGTLTYGVKTGAIKNTAIINVTASMENYKDTAFKVMIDLTDKTVVDITGVKVADKTYDGTAATITGTLSVKKAGTTESAEIGGLIYTYTSTDGKGYDSSKAPTIAGSYQLVVLVPDSNITYQGSTEPITFAITKKTVTVKAMDKEILIGTTIPTITSPIQDKDYTIGGLVESDKLNGTVTLQYASAPDNTKVGSIAIVIAGVTVGDNYNLSLVNGTLTIKQVESSNTTESSDSNTDNSTPVGKPTAATATTTSIATSSTTATGSSPVPQTQASSAARTKVDNTKADTNGDDRKETQVTMQRADGKTVTGWEAIAEAIQSITEETISNTTEPVAIKLELHASTTLPTELLEAIKGKNLELVLSLENGITWTMNGRSITGDTLRDIDLNVTKDTDSIPADTVAKLMDGRSALPLTLAHNGPFGFEATLTINLESENAGLYANLFYYNEETGGFELLDNSEIDEDGNAQLNFSHASSYVIVLDTVPMEDTNSNNTDSNNTSADKGINTIASEATDNSMSRLMILVILGIVVAVTIAGSVFYVFNRKNKKDEDGR